MKANETIEILSKMKASLTKGKPSWYENASPEDKANFDDFNSKKIEALEHAIDCLKCETRLARIQTMAHEVADFVDGVISREGDGNG